MSTETGDRYAALAAELVRLGRHLDGMGTELMRLRAAEAAAGAEGSPGAPAGQPEGPPVPAGPGGGPEPAHAPGPYWSGAHPWPGRGGPGHGAPAAAGPGPWWPAPAAAGSAGPAGHGPEQGAADHGGGPQASWPPSGPGAGEYPGPGGGRAVPRRPRSPLSGARLLAWTGGGVTLLGVVLLLALATTRGWFGPPAQLAGGAVLGTALIGLALRLHRRPDARVGAVTLAATGFAALYLVVAAATALYDYLAEVPALLLALAVAAGGVVLADRWRARPLAVGAVVGGALLAPALAWGWLLVGLVLALQLAALPVVLRRRWAALALVAAAGPVLYGALEGTFGDERTSAVAAALGVLAAGLATALPVARLLPARTVAVLVAGAPVPVLAASVVQDGWAGAALAGVAAVALAAFAAVPGPPRAVRVVAVAAAAVALFEATLVALEGSTATVVVLGQAIVATVLAAQLRARLPLAIGTAYGAVAVLTGLGRDAPLEALVRHPSTAYAGTGALVVGAAVSALVLVLAVVLLVAAARIGLVRADAGSARLWAPAGLVGLYGATSLIVTLALLVSPDRAGFTAGHALVTVSWTVVALVLLARGIRRPALRVAGMVLVGTAVAKLVLFDLVALDGLARVAAFLGAGLVLLAAGARYARMVAEAESGAGSAAASPTGPTP